MGLRTKSRSGLVKELDRVFSIYIRQRDKGVCFTCGDCRDWKEQNAGHFVPRGCMLLRWDEVNVNTQCVRCNKWLSGNLAEYTLRLQARYGLEMVQTLMAQKHQVKKHSTEELKNLIATYIDKALKLNQ